MSDILNTISKIRNLPEMPPVSQGYLETALREAGALIQHNGELLGEVKDLKDLKPRVETLETEHAEAKKNQTPKAAQERLAAFEAFGSLEDLGKLKGDKERLEAEANTRTLSDLGVNPKLFQRTLNGASVTVEGEGEAKKVTWRKDDKEYDSLEALGEADGLSAADVAVLKLEPEKQVKVSTGRGASGVEEHGFTTRKNRFVTTKGNA